MENSAVVLAATIHDTGARLIPAMARAAPLLRQVFAGVALNASDATPAAVLDAAREHLGARVMTHPQGEATIGRARRDAVRLALEGPAPVVLYSDFDHLLRWIEAGPAELQGVLADRPDLDLLVVGRSPRAFAAAPRRLRETEQLVNHIHALMTGRAWDLMFAVRRLSRPAAERIVRHGTVDTVANDVEWPLLAERAGLALGYAQADGLFYRTMEEFGMAADTQDDDPLQWIRRVAIAAEHATVLRRYLEL